MAFWNRKKKQQEQALANANEVLSVAVSEEEVEMLSYSEEPKTIDDLIRGQMQWFEATGADSPVVAEEPEVRGTCQIEFHDKDEDFWEEDLRTRLMVLTDDLSFMIGTRYLGYQVSDHRQVFDSNLETIAMFLLITQDCFEDETDLKILLSGLPKNDEVECTFYNLELTNLDMNSTKKDEEELDDEF